MALLLVIWLWLMMTVFLYGCLHILCSLWVTFGPDGKVKQKASLFGSDYVSIKRAFKA